MSSETIGQRVRRLREERKFSAAALAKTVGIRENALYKIESGDTKTPSLTTGLRLAAALGVDPWMLAFGRSRPIAAAHPAEEDGGDFEQQVATQADLQGIRKQIEDLQGTFERLERLVKMLEQRE